MQDTAEHVTPHTALIVETVSVHVPELVGPDFWILLPDLKDELDNKLFYRKLAEQRFLVILVKGLSCNTGQRTKFRYRVTLCPFVQPFDCPASAFFLISMLNISSATSIIVS